jgi:hypothetical protein
MNITEVDKPKVKKTIVVYSGRFQPFHKGHYAAYKNLVSKFGAGNVFIGSSNTTSQPKSPFNFKEKKKIATTMFDIPANRFVMVKNPYNPVEILSKFDADTTQYVAAVGEKDAERLGGSYFKPYRGKAGYGYKEIGYTYLVPPQAEAISGTDVRKNIGGADEKTAIEYFKKVYSKFDKGIFDLIRKRLIGENIKVGVDVGDNVLMGKFKNKKVKVKDISSDSHGMPTINGKQATTFRTIDETELYNPIFSIIERAAAEDIFNDFISNYLGEAESENPIMDKEIEYTNAAGEKKKIKVRAALRLAKDHPAHVEAEKLTGKDKKTSSKEEPSASTNQEKKPASEKPTSDSEPKTTGAEEPTEDPNKLSGSDFKTNAEKPESEKEKEEIKTQLDSEKSKLSDEETKTIEQINNPQSPERKGMMTRLKSAIKGFGKGIKKWAHHKKEMIGGTVDAVKALANGQKIGSVKNKQTGKWDYSDEKRKEQLHHVKHFAIDVGLLMGSMMLGGAGVAAAKAVSAGQGALGVASAAAQGSVGVFTHGFGGFGIHLGKDIVKHAALETLGFGGAQAAGGGAALSTATMGLFEISSTQDGNNKFIINFLEKVIKRVETYKLTDAQLLQSIKSYKKEEPKRNAADLLNEEHYVPATGMFNRRLSPQQKIDKLNPARAIEKSKIWHKTFSHHNPETGETEDALDSKTESINHFVEYATKRLKLNERPKINLVGGGEFAESQTSLGGYDDNTKEIFVSTEGRLTADILRTIAHEMVHRKQDEMGIIKDRAEDGKTGSSVENKAHAVAGILMREYGKINKKIFQEGIINEATSIQGAFNDDQPDGMFLPKGYKRKLGNNDGINKSDEWFTNGGYIQIDFPTADTIFGDDEQDQPYVIWRVKNLPRTDFKPTKFNKKNFVNEAVVDGTSNGESFRSPYSPDWEKHDKYGKKHAEIVGYDVLEYSSKRDAKKAAKNIPVNNPREENGPAKRTIHPSKGDAYAKDKADKWEMYPFNSRPNPYSYPDVYVKPKAIRPVDVIRERGYEHRIVSLLQEGGAYGHMSHPFDDMGLTFGDLKRIISGALSGRLELAREKTDGQALAISWKNGRLIAARNKGHLANAGANAMGIEDVASKFAGRGGLTDAYNFAMKDLNAAIGGLSEKQKEKIFNNGKCFMNLEVIWPESVNVIPYGQALLVFHGTVCYDDAGKAISADQSSARVLAGMIKQINANVQSKYTIAGPPVLELPKSKELSSKQGYWFGKLNKLQSKFGLSDSASVSDYHYAWWADFIDKQSPVKPDKLTKEALIRRWGFGEKSFRLNTISDKTLQNWTIEHDKINVPKQQRDNIKPFEEIFLGVGSEVLQFVTSVITVHPDTAIRAMKTKLDSVAQKVKQTGDTSIIKKFKNELERLNSLGGVDKIVAAEGIVFVYNGKTYKLTGTFAPLNQLLGIFYE